MAARRLANTYPAEILIDDQVVSISVKRLTFDEMGAFDRDYKRMSDPPSNRLIFVRRDTPDEQAKDDKENFVIQLPAIGERRLREMTAEQRQRYDDLDAKDEAFAKQVLTDTISNYVTVVDGQLEEPDGTPLTNGAQMLKHYGGRRDVLQQLVLAVYAENTLTDREKKLQKSLFALKRSLLAQAPAAPGPKPESVAAAAATEDSATSVDATGSRPQTPSGLEADRIVH